MSAGRPTLAILTLSLGMAINAVVFQNAGWTGGLAGTTVGVLKVFGLNIDYIEHPQRYATAVLIVVVVSATLVSVVRRSALGYRMLAVRENELAATAIGVDVARTKAVAFAVSSGIAAIAGVCLAFQGHTVEFTSFDVLESLFIVGYAVVGGVGHIAFGAHILGHAFGQVQVVFHHQDAIDAHAATSSGDGQTTVKVAPLPGPSLTA